VNEKQERDNAEFTEGAEFAEKSGAEIGNQGLAR
jgi:hypothetical protein